MVSVRKKWRSKLAGIPTASAPAQASCMLLSAHPSLILCEGVWHTGAATTSHQGSAILRIWALQGLLPSCAPSLYDANDRIFKREKEAESAHALHAPKKC